MSTDEHVRIVQNILGGSENTTRNGAKRVRVVCGQIVSLL